MLSLIVRILSSVDLHDLPSLRAICALAFQKCASLQSVSAVNLPLLERIGTACFAGCAGLSSVDSRLRSLCEQNRAKRKTKRVD